MPASPSPIEIDALRKVLSNHFGLVHAEGLPALLRAPTAASPAPNPSESRRYLLRSVSAPITVRVAERLDLQTDALIVDPQLGTIGIVHFLPAPNPVTTTPTTDRDPTRTVAFISKTIARRIGEAAYLRHLLLEELRPGEPQHGRAPYSVEVVFILADASFSPQLGLELRHIMREVALLHTLGVSLLEGIPAESDPQRTSQLMRGFSWLLHHTREWLRTQILDADPSHPGPPAEIRLEHFRLGGERRWCLSPDRMLHVVYGPNGSGKSSLVEAIELITTGCIDRLASEDHRAIITNRAVQEILGTAEAKPSASVTLQFPPEIASTPGTPPRTPNPPRTWQIIKEGVTPPLVPKDTLKPGAFRLNREMVDVLARGDSKARAQLLLTFFPDSYCFLSKSKTLLAERDQSLAGLPIRLRSPFQNTTGTFDESRAEKALTWVQDTAIPWDRLPALLPLDSTQINALLPLLPLTFESNYRRTGTAPSWEPVIDAARNLDDDLRALLVKLTTLTTCLDSARAFLATYQDASAEGADISDKTLPDRLQAWLELLAATDIHHREHLLLCALELDQPDANAPEHHGFPENITPILAQARKASLTPAAELRNTRLNDLRAKRDAAQRSLTQFRPQSDKPRVSSRELPELSTFDLGALDTLARAGAFGREFATVTPLLSQAIRDAFRDGKVVAVRAGDKLLVQVGASGGLRELLSKVEQVKAALQLLEAARTELAGPGGGLVGVLQQFRNLRRLANDLNTARNAAAAEFTQRLETPLGGALNEFTAMLTPARWAYDDIVSVVDSTAAEPSFGFVQRGTGNTTVPAPLRLNTAQISAFALAFFLLCHRARQHPLRLGILDDPFENMDELTVTAVARGLGRYLRLRAHLNDSPDRWQLILFLHGEQDVDRVRREVACATYLLPWLSPDAQLGREAAITSEKSEFIGESLQDLGQILSDISNS